MARHQQMTCFWMVAVPTSRLIVENPSEVVAIREYVRLMGKVGAAGINKIDAR